jgi:hypothetical protein
MLFEIVFSCVFSQLATQNFFFLILHAETNFGTEERKQKE